MQFLIIIARKFGINGWTKRGEKRRVYITIFADKRSTVDEFTSKK